MLLHVGFFDGECFQLVGEIGFVVVELLDEVDEFFDVDGVFFSFSSSFRESE